MCCKALAKKYKKTAFERSRQSLLECWSDMTYFRVDRTNTSLTNTPKRPFVEFSPHLDRANLMSSGIAATGRKRSRSTARKGRKRRSRVTKVRVVKGKVALRVGGFPGVQHVGASQLVRFVPLNKLRTAAKRVLGSPPRRGKRGRKGRKRKGRRH